MQAANQGHIAYQGRGLRTLRQVVEAIDRLGKMLVVHLKCLRLLRLHDGSCERLRILLHHENAHISPVDLLCVSVVLFVLVEHDFVTFGVVEFVGHVNVAGAGVASVSIIGICIIARVR